MDAHPVLLMLSTLALAWALTYLLHSTIFLGIAWGLSRVLPTRLAATKDAVIKTALVGGIVTATLQVGIGVNPLGGAIELPGATAPPTVPADVPVSETPDAIWVSTPDGLVPVSPATGHADPGRAGIVPVGEVDLLGIGRSPVRSAGEPAGASRDLRVVPAHRVGSPRSPLALMLADAGRISTRVLAPVLVLAWLVLASFNVGRVVLARQWLRSRLAARHELIDGPIVHTADRLSRELDFDRRVRVSVSDRIQSPIAFGRREICLPARAIDELEPEAVEALLVHELVHLVRRDPAWLFGSVLLERALFFQPLNRIVRRLLTENAEYLCDDQAARRTGSGLPLAKCLAQVATWVDGSRRPSLVPGILMQGGQRERSPLVKRVEHLVGNDSGRLPVLKRRHRLAVAAACFAVACLTVPAVRSTSTLSSLHATVLDGASGPFRVAGLETQSPPDTAARRLRSGSLARSRNPESVRPVSGNARGEDVDDIVIHDEVVTRRDTDDPESLDTLESVKNAVEAYLGAVGGGAVELGMTARELAAATHGLGLSAHDTAARTFASMLDHDREHDHDCDEVDDDLSETAESLEELLVELDDHETRAMYLQLMAMALEGGDSSLLEALIDGGELEARDRHGRSPLHVATEAGDLEAIERLLGAGARLAAEDDNGRTALHLAAIEGELSAIELLLELGADIDAEDEQGQTPLHVAVDDGDFEVVQLLCVAGANPDLRDVHGRTPLHVAIEESDFDIVRLLLAAGADPGIEDEYGRNALHRAIDEGDADIVATLVENGANLDAADRSGRTAVDWAERSGTDEIRELLEEAASAGR